MQAAQSSHRVFWERWFEELWDKRNDAIIDECVSDTCLIQGLPDTGDGRLSFRRFFRTFGAAFPDVHIQVEDCVENGEQSVVRCGGYVRDYNGRKHELTGVAFARIRDGKMVEAWNQWDFMSVLESAGVIKANTLSSFLSEQGKMARGGSR